MMPAAPAPTAIVAPKMRRGSIGFAIRGGVWDFCGGCFFKFYVLLIFGWLGLGVTYGLIK